MITDSVNTDHHMRRQCFREDAFKKCDHRAKWKGRRTKWKAFFAVLVTAGVVHAQEIPGEAAWRVWLEPKFMHAPVKSPILGAAKCELAAGWRGPFADEYFSRKQFELLKIGWDDFFRKARANAEADQAGLQPEYVRDANNVIQYAVLRSGDPLMASAVLAPKFLDRFKETLGEKVLVVVPSRHTAFVFPSLASEYQQYAEMVFDAYKETAFPVSVEVFELSAHGWKAIGIYEEP